VNHLQFTVLFVFTSSRYHLKFYFLPSHFIHMEQNMFMSMLSPVIAVGIQSSHRPVADHRRLLQLSSQRATQLNWTEPLFSSVQLHRSLWRGKQPRTCKKELVTLQRLVTPVASVLYLQLRTCDDLRLLLQLPHNGRCNWTELNCCSSVQLHRPLWIGL